MRSHWVKIGPNSNDWCPYKRDRETHRNTQEQYCLMTEEEIGVMCLQTKECQGLLATTRSSEEVRTDHYLEPLEGLPKP